MLVVGTSVLGATGIRRTADKRKISLSLIVAALAGAALSLCAVSALSGGDGVARLSLSPPTLWAAACGGAGTWLTLILRRDMAGGPLPRLLCTLFWSTVLVGSLLLPGYGTMFGPLSATLAALQWPVLTLAWVGSVAVAQSVLDGAPPARVPAQSTKFRLLFN